MSNRNSSYSTNNTHCFIAGVKLWRQNHTGGVVFIHKLMLHNDGCCVWNMERKRVKELKCTNLRHPVAFWVMKEVVILVNISFNGTRKTVVN